MNTLSPLRPDMKKNNNELGQTQNDLMPSEFVPVRFSSVLFSSSFMNRNSWPTLKCIVSFTAKRLSKSLVFGGYHEIFKNKKPQINADKRGFVIAYLRSFAFICGFIDPNKHQQILLAKTGLYGLFFNINIYI